MQLKPVIGPVQLAFYSVGVIIGAGIYSIIGTAAGLAGSSLWLSFIIGAFVALLTGLSYAEMTTSFPHAGAEYVYLRRALPNFGFPAFSVGIVILAGGAATAATVSVSFGGYLQQFVDIPVGVSALLLLAFCTALSIWGLKESGWANILFTAIEIAGLLLVAAAGFAHRDITAPLFEAPSPGILPAAALLFFVYLGFEEIANLTEEVRDPARSMPRAIFWSIGVTTLLYVIVALAAVTLASPADLAASQAPLATAIVLVWPGAGNFLSAIALFATANTVLITLIAASRLTFSMGRDGEIPSTFASILPERGTPWLAALLVFAASALILPLGDVKFLAELSSFSALLAFFAVNVALIILRYRLPHHPRPFRLPFSIGRMPLVPVVAIAGIVLLLAYFEWQIHLIGGAAIVLTFVLYTIRAQWRKRQ